MRVKHRPARVSRPADVLARSISILVVPAVVSGNSHRPGQDQGAGGPLGGAPGLLGSVTGIALVQAPDRRLLRVLSLVKDGLDLADIPHAAIPLRVHGGPLQPHPHHLHAPGYPQDGPGWPKQPPQGTLLVWVGSGPQKRPSWAILGVFAGPAPRARPRPAPGFTGTNQTFFPDALMPPGQPRGVRASAAGFPAGFPPGFPAGSAWAGGCRAPAMWSAWCGPT